MSAESSSAAIALAPRKPARLALADLLPKVQRRLPARLAGARCWLDWRDRLIAAHHLSPTRRDALSDHWARCRTPQDYFEFAGNVFPSHQIQGEILGFLEFARTTVPATVLEIGTASGGTQFLFGAVLPEVTLKIGVDLFVQNTRLLRTFVRPGCRQVFLDGSSYAPETIARVRETLAGRPIDVLFIDGDHTYAGVKADLEAYAPLVRPGGLIAMHDIVPDFRTRYGRDTGRWAGDVPQYWREVREGYAEKWEFIADPEQDGLGIGVVRAPGL